ncbi:Golgi-specific brefeldin A-resistance guanine nucleotide exchange factor 1 isoform X1 [Schistocerca piceifrons]|uniref:Golgi-specific brefeldin A-resistance guanine nucleotide exchange factor 1 isoform X1 n=1 Tax=Schistocerca piceifrons TaxID=274613 RepID=UPI001F5F88C8|nr:Golgi-specific brefeldin A-resistance guanine nucleotide exchange factor 1 isoform X1 [Schistocerca piceifrons]
MENKKMVCPGNGIYVVQGEMTILLTAMRRGARWSSHSYQDEGHDKLIRSFTDVKEVLNQLGDLRDLDPNHYLGPFLEVIRSEETTGPVTSLALSSVNKFLSYGLIDPGGKSVPTTVQNIADAVTHARFMGTDQDSDGVVLLVILQVLRTLMFSPEGIMLSNDSVCEILMSCFRICFESRLSELLRKSAEHCLKDMVQFLFSRLPLFSEDHRIPSNVKKLKVRAGAIDSSHSKRRSRNSFRMKSNRTSTKNDESSSLAPKETTTARQTEPVGPVKSENIPANAVLATTPVSETGGNIVDMQGSIHHDSPPLEYDSGGSVHHGSPPPEYDSGLEDIGSAHIDSSHSEKVTSEQLVQLSPSDSDSCVVINVETDSVSNEICECSDSVESPVPDAPPTEPVNSVSVNQGENKQVLTDSAFTENESTASEDQVTKQDTISCQDVSVGANVKPNNESHIGVPCVISDEGSGTVMSETQDYVNPQGVRFINQEVGENGELSLVPYGIVCIQELFRFLVSLCNPLDKQNDEMMIHMGLTLLTVALETGADSIGKYNSLLALVKDEFCRNIFSLLSTERLSIFAAVLQVSFLLFESLRTHLKFQLELYLSRLMDIIIATSQKISFEQKEMALESIVQLWRIPGLVTELYLNYDCDLYSPNLFEDLTKLLSKNAFPVSGIYNTHLLSLDALLTIIDSIEAHCYSRILNEKQDGRQHSDGLSDIVSDVESLAAAEILKYGQHTSRFGRQKISENIPSHEQLMAIKHKKKLLATGTEHFNSKPKKGIQFLQDHHLLSTPLDPQEVVQFLRENPRLDKKMIGEYISNRNNLQVLDSFVKSFDFSDMRIDEALRMYLETFRLPGESPLISLIMEHFAEHWHKCNGEPFANADAAFTLAYAVIMLNVDQHNYNVKRQNNPMTCEEFKRNLKKVNGGEDFDQEMLDDIYKAIRSEEIVMPAEQTGLVRENYLWKVLLRRGASKDGIFIHSPNGLFDHDLFSLIWGPTVAALSYIFDKSNDTTIYQKAVSGFRKCAMISAHYGMSNDFDSLIISLCKFTMLLNNAETPDNLTVSFGANPKAQLAAKTVFNLAHRHGDILREGWKNVLDCILQLYRCKLLPKALVEAEDFIDPSGKISLMREETPSQKTETGLLSSLYLYIALGTEPSNQKSPSPEDQEHIRSARACVRECHVEQLITESKFLRIDSLQELVKALIYASHGPDGHVSLGLSFEEDVSVFFLELLLKIVIQNRDRVSSIWQVVRDHMYSLVMSASACDHCFLMERSVVGLLRLAIRLMRREDMSPMVLHSLRMLLLLKPLPLLRVSRQIAYGLYELLKTSAANIHSETDWTIIFTLLECVGAGAHPPRVVGDNNGLPDEQGLCSATGKSDGELTREENSDLTNDRGCTSDSELSRISNRHGSPIERSTSPELSSNSGGGSWIWVGPGAEIQPLPKRNWTANQFSIVHERELLAHDPYAHVKCCESLAFLVRDVAHITPYNFEHCVHCIRTFVEASLNGSEKRMKKKTANSAKEKPRKKASNRRKEEKIRAQSPQRSSSPYDADESDSEELPSGYQQVSIQLLDLMHTLHTRTAHIFQWWAEENGDTDITSLWGQAWCPLLQGIARLCCDSRRQVRMSAITYLQRALLVHDLQTLTAQEWEGCFNKVLFPLLTKLLEPISPDDPGGLEETRMRAATVLSKVFLHHLTPLQSLPTFSALWLTILDYMRQYMNADKSDLLYEAIPESLKNMLLVMDSAGVFSASDGYSQLWNLTWDHINKFLPTLKEELFKSHPSVEAQNITESMVTEEGNDAKLSHIPDPQADAAVTVTGYETIAAREPVSVRPSSIILQPASSLPHNISAPIFTHMGQQMISTAIGPPVSCQVGHSSEASFIHQQQAPPPVNNFPTAPSSVSLSTPLYISPPQTVSPVPLYPTSRPQQADAHIGAVTTIPSHYFGQDTHQRSHDFFLSGPEVQQQQQHQHQHHQMGLNTTRNTFLLNTGVMEGLPILSPPTGSKVPHPE